MGTLAEIRAKLKEQNDRASGNFANVESAVFPHWNIKEGTSATVRFLPDADPANTFFWVEKLQIKLPFSGIKGQPAGDNQVVVQVPCMEMYGETCPILSEVRPWYKTGDQADADRAKIYWKKKSYLFQGLVVDAGSVREEKLPENLVRRFNMTSQLFTVIKAALMDPEFEDLPTDYDKGFDFRITKTKKGNYADYSTSAYARRSRSLTDSERQIVNDNGLFNLVDHLPKKPDSAGLKAIMEMFEVSVDGGLYDPDLWGKFYRPVGAFKTTESNDAADENKDSASTSAPAAKQAEIVEAKASEAPAAKGTTDNKSKAADILAAIHKRKQAQG